MAFFDKLFVVLALSYWLLDLSTASHLVDRATVKHNATTLKAQYDYVIVGGGTSGLTVAYRLTEDPAGKKEEVSRNYRKIKC